MPTTSSTSPRSWRPSEAGWFPPTRCRPTPNDVKIMRALVKETLGHSQVLALAADTAEACATLKEKGTLHPSDRKRAKTNPNI